jgi:protein-disulfide isomerase
MSLNRIVTAALILGFSGAFLVSCGPSPEEIAEIKKNQEAILAKIDKELIPKIEKIKVAPAPAAAAARPGRPDPNTVYAFPVGDSAAKGPDDAWVTIIEVSDFQCPFCKRVGPTLKQVQDKYGNDVRIAFKHNPLSFHKRAKPAARAAECAHEQGKFWEMHDVMFENQRQLEDAQLESYAVAIEGLDAEKWKACYASNKYDKRIDADQKTAVSLGARGTPAFFINGKYLSGAQPFAAFDTAVGAELSKAKASSIPKDQYYKKAVVEKGKKKL